MWLRTLPWAAWLLALGALLASATTAAPALPERSIGLNKFDLAKQYLGTASGGDGGAAHRKVTQAMGRKAIVDAGNIGVRFLRVSATGFGPMAAGERGDLDLWRRDAAAHWALMDRMMDDLDGARVRLVPTFVWNMTQFPAMTGETVSRLLKDPESKSYKLLTAYVREFVTRYGARPTVLFYELTNELNLGADIDAAKRCREARAERACAHKDNYTSADMIGFTRRLAALIKQLDPSRLIASGFAVPRAAAQHLRQRPEGQGGKGEWKPDGAEQLLQYLRDVHEGVDIVSVHLYAQAPNRRFGGDELALLATLKDFADRIGKPLFVGEFGDPDAPAAGPGSFTERMLERIAELRIPYSAVWTWQFYQRNPYTTTDNKNNTFSLEPGYTDRLIERLKLANARLGNPVPPPKNPDTQPPQVILTWPLECARLRSGDPIHAVASDDSGRVGRVEFLVDGRQVEVDTQPPYRLTLDEGALPAGEHVAEARAVDAAGNAAAWRTRFLVGANAPTGTCASAP